MNIKKIAFLTALLFAVCTNVYADPIYSYETTTPISDSVTLTRVEQLYSDRNISYSYIKADLSDENTSVKLLKSDKGSDVLDTVSNLASTDSDTVAAVNADFFSVFQSGKGFSLGIEMQDGKLLQSPVNPSTMATVYSKNDTMAMSYLDFHIMAVAPNGAYNEVRHLNKHTNYYGDILMYTSDFNGGMSPAPGGEIAEVVVADGKIAEFRRNMPSVQIPENGCVLVVSEGVNMFLANNFNVGDDIKFDYYITPAIYDTDTAFGAGAMLVSEGQALTSFSHKVSGYQPRSAVGIDKSGTTLYLVAVDGRQDASKGMTMPELANLMVSLGCYSAANLDGGGSTNMVASTVWDKNLRTVNLPTENRKVINAVGITSSSRSAAPVGIAIECDKDTVFIGQPVNVKAVAHNENMRPLSDEITLVSAAGPVENGVFTPQTAGTAVIGAYCADISAAKEILVTDTVSGIETTEYLQLGEGGTASLDIHIFDDYGNYSQIINTDLFEITSSDPSVVSVSGRTLNAHKAGDAVISVRYGDVISYTSVCVSTAAPAYWNGFETLNGSFISYPQYVGGSFEISGEQAHSGSFSGKLSYNFTDETDVAKGAYFALQQPPEINGDCDSISIYAYTDNDFAHELRAQFTDANGKTVISSFGKITEKNVWQYLQAAIPSTAARPVTLDRVYALYLPGDIKDSGHIYIDDLYFNSSAPVTRFKAAEQNIYKKPTALSTPTGSFAVGALSKGTKTAFSKLTDGRLSWFIASHVNGVLLSSGHGFSFSEDANAAYITLDLSGGSIRGTSSEQWAQLANAMYMTSKSNVFLLSESSVFGNSEFENKVLKDYLSSLDKNIFVITGGDRNTYKNVDEVSYFTISNTDKETLSPARINTRCYLEFTFSGNVTFEWKNIYW